MKQFLGLMKKEHLEFFSMAVVILGLAVLAIFVGPIILVELYDTSLTNSRFVITSAVLVLLVLYQLIQSFTSLNKAIKQKDLWLHNTMKMEGLIGAKIVYQALQLWVLSTISYIGYFFCGDILKGTYWQHFVSYVCCVYLALAAYISIFIISLFFYAFSLQLKKWIGILSNVVTFIFIILFLEAISNVNINLFKYGYISESWLNENLSKFNGKYLSIVSPTYVLEEVLIAILFLGILILSSRWIEKVMLR